MKNKSKLSFKFNKLKDGNISGINVLALVWSKEGICLTILNTNITLIWKKYMQRIN